MISYNSLAHLRPQIIILVVITVEQILIEMHTFGSYTIGMVRRDELYFKLLVPLMNIRAILYLYIGD